MKIRFPIGDWSDDGHSSCDYYFATTTKTTQDVREAHFKCKEIYGFDIGDIASDYEDNFINDDILDIIIREKIIDESFENKNLNSEVIFDIWLSILNKIDPSLHLISLNDKDYEDINFYGSDDKKRHLETPGYGVFLD